VQQDQVGALQALNSADEWIEPLTVQNLEDAFRWPANHSTITHNRDGALHQLGMSEKELDHLVLGRVAVIVEPEFGKVTVVSDHVGDRVRQLGHDASKRGLIERILQVLDDGELDFAFFEQGDRPAGLASTRVEVQRHMFVGHLRNLPLLARPFTLGRDLVLAWVESAGELDGDVVGEEDSQETEVWQSSSRVSAPRCSPDPSGRAPVLRAKSRGHPSSQDRGALCCAYLDGTCGFVTGSVCCPRRKMVLDEHPTAQVRPTQVRPTQRPTAKPAVPLRRPAPR
jgi:hypothetical protein